MVAHGAHPPPVQNSAVVQNRLPGSALMPPRWLSANLAYLRDIDYLGERTGRPKAGPKPKPKPQPKPKAKAGAAPAS